MRCDSSGFADERPGEGLIRKGLREARMFVYACRGLDGTTHVRCSESLATCGDYLPRGGRGCRPPIVLGRPLG